MAGAVGEGRRGEAGQPPQGMFKRNRWKQYVCDYVCGWQRTDGAGNAMADVACMKRNPYAKSTGSFVLYSPDPSSTLFAAVRIPALIETFESSSRSASFDFSL